VKTERDVRRVAESGDTIPEQAAVYAPPRQLAPLADHRTMDVKAIRLAAAVDPRQAPTELRLPVPPLRKDNSWIAPLVLALLAIGFIGLWWVTPAPLPLASPEPPVTLGAPAAVVPRVQPVAPVPAATAEPAPPVLEPTATPGAPVDARSAIPPVATPVSPAPTPDPVPRATSGAAPATQPSAPQRPKQGRDPWLE
jgi:hypothetical protein